MKTMDEHTPIPTPDEQPRTPQPDRDLFGKTPRGRENWDHRRGEPRWFALIWTLFLMGAAGLSLGGTAASGTVDASSYRAGARLLVLVLGAGIVLLWPMIRLSQRAPSRPIGSVLGDLVIVVAPVMVLLWPQALPFLGGWGLMPTLAATGLLACWAAIVAGMLALAWPTGGVGRDDGTPGPPSPMARAAWMAVLVVLAAGGPTVVLVREAVIGRSLSDPGVDASVGFLVSPVTAGWECIRDRSWSGVAAMVAPGHWAALLWTGVGAAAIWIGVIADALISRPDRG